MGIVCRYVIVETFRVFCVALAAAVLLMTLVGSAIEGMRHGLPPDILLQVTVYVLPDMLQFVLPGCILFAVCMVFGELSANNELLGLKSSGLSPLVCVWPAIALAFMISVCACLNQEARATSRAGLKRLIFESFVDIAHSTLKVNRSFKANGVAIHTNNVADGRLTDATIVVEHAGGPFTIWAEEFCLFFDSDLQGLRYACRNGYIESNQGTLHFGDSFKGQIGLERFAPTHTPEQLPPAELPTLHIPIQVAHETQEIGMLRQGIEVGSSQEHNQTRRDRLARLCNRQRRLFRLQAEIPRRLANGFACLCFAVIGIPAATLLKSDNYMSVFGLCFLPILLLYYPLLVVGEMIARQGVYPQYMPWLADAVLLAVGLFLMRQLTRK